MLGTERGIMDLSDIASSKNINDLVSRKSVLQVLEEEQIRLQELASRRLDYSDDLYASINARIRLIIQFREVISEL